MKCKRCGGALRSPESIARGMGDRCAMLIDAASDLEARVMGPPGSSLLFPGYDAALVAAAKKEVEIAAGKPKRGIAALIDDDGARDDRAEYGCRTS